MNEIIVIDGKRYRIVRSALVRSEYQDSKGKWHPYAFVAETIELVP